MPFGQYALVGGGYVRVRADHRRSTSVDEEAHRLLLAGRLGMHVDDNGVGALLEAAGGELGIDGAEWIVELGP